MAEDVSISVTKDQKLMSLPKWAQHRISKLTADVKYWQEIAQRVEAGKTGVRLGFARPGQEGSHFLPDNEPIVFNVSDGEISCQLRVDHPEGTYLDVNALGSHLVIRPRAANAFRLTCE